MTRSVSRRKVLSLLGGGALAAAFPAVSLRAQQGGPLRLGIQTTIWGAVAIVAEAEKLFEKAGVNVTVNKFGAGAAARDAMISGHIDLVSIGATPFVVGVAKSGLVAIGTVLYGGSTLALVAGKKSGIKTVADLKGKKVASQVGSSTDSVFQNRIAPSFGLKKGDFQVINVKFADHVSALASGSVDAFAGVEPNPSLAELEGYGTILTDYSKYDIVPVLLGTNRNVLDTRGDDVVKFMRGWFEAVKLCREQPAKAANLVGEFFRGRGLNIKDEVFRLALGRMDITPTFRPELKGYLKEEAERLVKRGQLTEAPNLDHALDERILKKIA